MVGRPKKVINRLVEKWEHEQLLKVMARKIQRAKPTLVGKTGSSSRSAKSTPASVSPSRRPSIVSTPSEPLSAHVANPRADTCPEAKKRALDKLAPGAPLIAELERAANGGKASQPGKVVEKPAWKGPLDDMVGDFGAGFDFDELPTGPPQRRKTFAGFEDSVSWDPLPRPTRPSATPQAKPPAAPLPKKTSPAQKPQTRNQTQTQTQKRKQNQEPVLLVIPNEPVGPLRPKPRLSRKSAGASDDVSKEAGDVSKARSDVGKARAPLQAKGELLNAMPVDRPAVEEAKKAERPAGLQQTGGKPEDHKGSAGSAVRDVTSAASVAPGRKEAPARKAGAEDGEKSPSDGTADGGDVPTSDVSPRQPEGVRRLPSSKIPRPRGTPGFALAHRARHSLRFGGGVGELLSATEGAAVGSEGDPPKDGEAESLSARRRYTEQCEEEFPVHQADSAEFLIRTPSSGIDQPLTASEEAALERQAGSFPTILLQRNLDGSGSSTERSEVSNDFGTALQQEIAGLNNSLDAMKETLRGLNGSAAARRRSSGKLRRGKDSARSTGSRASDVSSQEEGDTCRTGESEDEGGLARALKGLTLVGNDNLGEGRDRENGKSSEAKDERMDPGKASDLTAQIADQERIRQALLTEISARTVANPLLAEHQRDFLSESQGEWAVVTGEESHVSACAPVPVSRDGVAKRDSVLEDDYEDDFEAGAAEEAEGRGGDEGFDVEGVEGQFEAAAFDVEGEELVEVGSGGDQKASPRAGFLARLSYQVDGVRGSREESLPASPERLVAGGFAQLTARGTKRVPDMEGLTAEIEKLEQEMQRLRR